LDALNLNKMTIKGIRELTKHLAGRTELIVIFNGETDTGTKLPPGVGYFDVEEDELVYLGAIKILKDEV
jgi:hypothetical protein